MGLNTVPIGDNWIKNLDEFLENFQRGGGGGVISDPKTFIADLSVLNVFLQYVLSCLWTFCKHAWKNEEPKGIKWAKQTALAKLDKKIQM